MSFSSSNSEWGPYPCAGGETVFAFDNLVLDPLDLIAIDFDAAAVPTVLTYPADYSVNGVGNPAGGSVVTATGRAAGHFVMLLRRTARKQITEGQDYQSRSGVSQEADLDRPNLGVQELWKHIERRLLSLAETDKDFFTTRLPARVANSLLGLDASKNPFWSGGLSSIAISAALTAFVQSGSIALATALLAAASETQPGVAELANDAEILAADAVRIATSSRINGLLGRAFTPGGRLSLTTALSVTTADVAAATSIFYTPHAHGLVWLYDAARWVPYQPGELTLALDSDSGHAGYHQSGKNFDLFIGNDAGTIRLGSGPAWTNDTARADAIARVNGRWVNNASIVLRFGASSGNTFTAPANTALYVGTFRASANGQTEDSLAKRFVWNTYNRVPRGMAARDAADSWTYTLATLRQANANAANQCDFVIGLSEDMVEAEVLGSFQNTTVGVVVLVHVGLDSTSVPAAGFLRPQNTSLVANQPQQTMAAWRGYPGIGRHFLAWLEFSAATGTTTWFGDGGGTLTISGIHATILA